MTRLAVAVSIAVLAAGCSAAPDDDGRDASASGGQASAPRTSSPTLATTSPTPATSAVATTSSTPTTTAATTTVTTDPPTTTTMTITTTTTTTTTTTLPPPTETSCRQVAYLGDSTSVGIDGETGVVASDQALGSRLDAVGVDSLVYEVSGGRAIVERLDGQESGAEVAARLAANGFDGCWVVGLGTNDAANIAAGASTGVRDRVDVIMGAAAGRPVVWFDAATIRTDGFWAAGNMAAWNAELASVLDDHPNATLVAWSDVVPPDSFLPDGIHPTDRALGVRADLTASVLLFLHPRR